MNRVMLKVWGGRLDTSDFSEKSDVFLRDKTKFNDPLRKSSYKARC